MWRCFSRSFRSAAFWCARYTVCGSSNTAAQSGTNADVEGDHADGQLVDAGGDDGECAGEGGGYDDGGVVHAGRESVANEADRWRVGHSRQHTVLIDERVLDLCPIHGIEPVRRSNIVFVGALTDKV